MSTSANPPRSWKRTLFKIVYILIVTLVGLAVLEAGARFLGLGNPVLYYNDAWGGLRLLPAQRVTRLQGATVTIDSNGYRTPVPDEPGALRVLYVGDSVTWGGSSVDDSQIFTEVAADSLRSQGRAVYAMNAGVNATSLLNQAEIYRRYGDKLDALVWLFPWGDTERSFATAGLLWPATSKPRFALVEVIDHLIMRYWLPRFRVVPPREESFVKLNAPAGRDDFFKDVIAEREVRNLDAVRAAVAQAVEGGVPVVIGVTPYRKGQELAPLPTEADDFLKEIAAAGAVVFDVSAALTEPGVGADELYLDMAHFNADGHRLVGEALGSTLDTVIADTEAAR
jgi:lysophospholipase L1-like esterase